MSRRPIDANIEAGESTDGAEGPVKEGFKDALARWATGVSIVAVRDPDDGKVHATTVSSLGGVSADPPRIVFSLGPGAQALPFLTEARRFAVSILGADQRRVAARFTDSFPVGPSPFPDDGVPVIPGSHAALVCVVEEIIPVDASRLVVGRVLDTEVDGDADPLLFYQRTYRTLE